MSDSEGLLHRIRRSRTLALGEQEPELLAAWHRRRRVGQVVRPLGKHVRFIAVPGPARKDVRLESLPGASGTRRSAPGWTRRIRPHLQRPCSALTDRFARSAHPPRTRCVIPCRLIDLRARHPRGGHRYGRGQPAVKARIPYRARLAGAEITRFAARWPERTDKLVYLDASHDFAGIDSVLGANPAWPPGFAPQPGTATDTLNARRERSKRYRFGYWSDAMESGMLRSPASVDGSDACFCRTRRSTRRSTAACRLPRSRLCHSTRCGLGSFIWTRS